jgi:hypothetical protein
MKKMIVFLSLIAIAAVSAFAEMDSRVYTLQAIAAATNSANYVIRGELEAIKVDCVGTSTGTVTVTTAELTAFNKATIAADATFLPRIATHTTAGAAATFVGGTNDTANTWYGKVPLSGVVTVRYIGESAASTTNNVVVTLIYSK